MFATAKQLRTNAASRGFGRGAATHRRCRDRPHKGSAGRDQDDRDTLRRLLSPAFPAAETEQRINRGCSAGGGHSVLASSPAVERLAAGALAATQLAGVEPHQRRPRSSRQGARRRALPPTCPAGAMMLLIPWRVVAAETAAAKIDRRAPPISVLMISGRRRSMELAPFAATGTLHIAGAVSELASGATRNLRGNAAGSLARI
jgi:hypothetical protein